MRLRTQAILLGVFSYLVSPLGFALGLGEIKVNSPLNQPLDAEIQLLQVRDLSAQELLVGLGSAEDFQRVGVDRPFLLNDLKFIVDLASPTGPIIRVTSTQVIREPFLNFIIQAHWPSGKLLREYTLLLDLPVFSKEPVRAVQAARSQAPAQPARATQRQNSENQNKSPAPRSVASGETYGPVASSDTLWSIAAKIRPADDVSMQQTMLAIQRLNPEAFINDNINLLKKGAVLRLPSEQEMNGFDPLVARREVASQNRDSNTAPESQIDATRGTGTPTAAAEQVKGRVKLSSATDITGSKSGSGSGEGEQDADALRTQLLSTQEELASAQRENTDLNARVAAMDEQVQTMEKLLEVANGDLRKLEIALKEKQNLEGVTETTETITTDPEAAVSSTEAVTTDGDTTSESATTESAAAVEPVTTPTQEETPVEPAPPVSAKKSLMDLVMANIMYIGGAFALLIAGLVYFVMARRGDNDDDDFEFNETETPDEDPIEQASHLDLNNTVNLSELQANTEDDDTVTLESLGSMLLADNLVKTPPMAEVQDHVDEDYDELDTTLHFDVITDADIEAATTEKTATKNVDVASSAELDALSLDSLDATLDLDLDDVEEDFELDLELDESFESSEEGISSDLDFDGLADDATEESPQSLAFDLDDSELELGVEETSDEIGLDLDTNIRSTEVEEEDDDLDLSSLAIDEDEDTTDDLDLTGDSEIGSLDLDDLALDAELTTDSLLDAESDLDIESELEDLSFERELDDSDDESELTLEDEADLLSLGDDLAEDTSLELDIDDSDLDLESDELEIEEIDAEEDIASAEVDTDFDSLDTLDVDLESLDHELDELESDFDGDLAGLDDDSTTVLDSDKSAAPLKVTPNALLDIDSALSADMPDFDPDSDDDSEPGFIGDSDEVATKIDLLRVFVDMGDTESALSTLEEIREDGNAVQKAEAEALFAELS